MQIVAIILAAGASTRMGRSKQLLTIHGNQLLQHTIDEVEKAGIEEIIVVLGAYAEEHKNAIHGSFTIIYNDDWTKGMGSSIKAGVSHITQNRPACDAALFIVCDQPLLTDKYLTVIKEKAQKTTKPIIASFYNNTVGVPALFHKSIFSQLLSLDDQSGAKPIMIKNSNLVESVDFPEGAFDLDTQEDVENFLRIQKR